MYIISERNKLNKFEIWLRANTQILNNSTNLCEVIKHPINELYAIPICIDMQYFTDSELFINDEIVNTLPENWTWLMPEKVIRIIINNKGQLQHILGNDVLGQLLTGLRADFKEQTFIEEIETTVYVANILPEYQAIFDNYTDIIKIEINGHI